MNKNLLQYTIYRMITIEEILKEIDLTDSEKEKIYKILEKNIAKKQKEIEV